MNREQAKLELDATTLRPQDASEEALAWMNNDEALAEWHQRRLAFDEKVSAAMKAMEAPEGLRERLLKGKETPVTKWRSRAVLTVGAALAACVVLGWTLWLPDATGMPEWQAESLLAVAKVDSGFSPLDEREGSFEGVRDLLAKSGSIIPHRVPGCLGRSPTFGCKRVQIAGRPATIVCFKLASGGEAHLVVLNREGLDDAAPEGAPKIERSKKWAMASWSDGGQTYLLATTSGEEELRRLMGEV